jgi:hypothetical protein
MVVPDTCGTFFQLCSFGPGVLGSPDLILSQRVASVRFVHFTEAAQVSSAVGVLEYYGGGGEPGGARRWVQTPPCYHIRQ